MTTALAEGAITQTVEVAGTEVEYIDSVGTGDGRTPIVLVHGTGATPQSHFGYIFPMLATRGRVIAIKLADPVGHVEGGHPLEISQFVEQVSSVITASLGSQPAALVGYSLGAVIAAATAAAHPAQIHSLTLVSGWAQTDNQQLLRNDVWRELRALGSDKLKEFTVFCAFGGPFLASKLRSDLQPAIDAVVVDAFTEAQMDLNRDIDIREQLDAIQAPTLVVAGIHDQMVPVRHQKYLFGAIEDCRYTEIATGHAVVFERPAELLRVIETFTNVPHAHAAGTVIPTLKP